MLSIALCFAAVLPAPPMLILAHQAVPEADVAVLRELLEVEEYAGVPGRWRGILLAACVGESRCRPDPKPGDGGLAVGILQMHPWWETDERYLVDRRNHVAAARAWLAHVLTIMDHGFVRSCDEDDRFPAAEAWVSKGGKFRGCKDRTGHTRRHRRWRRHARRM